MKASSAVDRERDAGHVGRFRATEPDNGGRDFLRLSDTVQGVARPHGVADGLLVGRGRKRQSELERKSSVSTAPGQTVLTRMSNAAASIASAFDAICSPAFEAQ